MLKWLFDESKRLGTEKQGGLILDEMSVQEDIQMCAHKGTVYMEGLVGLDQAFEDMRKMVKKQMIYKWPNTYNSSFSLDMMVFDSPSHVSKQLELMHQNYTCMCGT